MRNAHKNSQQAKTQQAGNPGAVLPENKKPSKLTRTDQNIKTAKCD
jgi:hypothetical protein